MNDLAAVLDANADFYAAFANRNVAQMDALWAREAQVSCIHPGWMPLESREDVMSSWAAILANPDQPRVVAGNARVTPLGEAAVVYCREFVAGAALVATNVFVREAGTWRLVHHHSSPVSVIG